MVGLKLVLNKTRELRCDCLLNGGDIQLFKLWKESRRKKKTSYRSFKIFDLETKNAVTCFFLRSIHICCARMFKKLFERIKSVEHEQSNLIC